METPPPPSSPYRVGNWTITQLKEELKIRNLSPAGRKQELIERLEQYDLGSQVTPGRRRGRSPDRSPTRARGRSASKKRTADSLVGTPKRGPGRPKKVPQSEWLSTPLRMTPPVQKPSTPTSATRRTPTRLSTPRAATPTRKSARKSDAKSTLKTSILVASFTTVLFLLAIPFILKDFVELEPIRRYLSWYLTWSFYGVIAALGVTPESNTWLLNLGPFIARVTSSAYICNSTNFNAHDMHDLSCPRETSGSTNIFCIFSKVIFEVLSWSFGTALAELIPFVVAVAFVRALQLRPNNKISKLILGYIVAFQKSFGQSEALLLASLPNPLVETTGIFCGLLSLDARSFVRALIIGKVLIRSTIQALMVILVFSKEIIEPALKFIKQYSPSVANALFDEVTAQRQLYQQPAVLSSAIMSLRSLAKIVYLGFIVFMALYSIFTMIKLKR